MNDNRGGGGRGLASQFHNSLRTGVPPLYVPPFERLN